MNENLELKVIKANNEALTQHFIKVLCKIEERTTLLEVALEELRSEILWIKEEVKGGE